MTPAPDPRTVRLLDRSPPATLPELGAWNQGLNRTHAMAALRARGGWIVRRIEARRRRVVARAVLAVPHAYAVDAGSEDGWMAEAWAGDVERLVLVDVDPEMLARSALLGRPGVTTLVADVTDPQALAEGLEDGGLDVVVLSALLEHLPESRQALDAFQRFLRPGGHFVVYVPADRPILFLKRVLKATGLGALVRGLSLEPAPGHLHTFDRHTLGALVAPYGRVRAVTFDPVALGYVAVVQVGKEDA